LFKRRAACMVFILIFLSGIISSFRIEWARADSAIYIKADGSIYPTNSPISTTDNVTYTLTDNISGSDGIIVERNNTIIDGNGYTLQGSNVSNAGFLLSGVRNVTIRKTAITNFDLGFELNSSSDNTLSSNNVACRLEDVYIDYSSYNILSNNNLTSSQEYAIDLHYSSNNSILNNNVAHNQWGILLFASSNNTWSGNNIIANVEGIRLDYSSANRIFHNNFIKNRWQANDDWKSTGTWDNGVEGNYWSDYNGTDSNQDGIGDTPYTIIQTIDENNTDHYPLMGSFQSFNMFAPNHKFEEVDIISNSTFEKVELGINPDTEQYPYLLNLTVHAQNETSSFCRITFPNDLLNSSSYPVYVAGNNATLSKIVESNGTQTTLYFTYSHPFSVSDYYIDILPEFPFLLILSLFMIATLFATIVCRRRHLT
jgi:parallel beta-helix repeat protein